MKFSFYGLLLFSAFNAHAIKGAYLPNTELNPSVCKIVVGKMRQVYVPSYQNGYATGTAPFEFSDENVDLCSSTLVSPNTIITATHCFTGNNEQDVARGWFPYPKMENGKLIEGCDPKTWPKNPKCIARKEFGIVMNKWENVRVECPAPNGKTEIRPLPENTGYPNPLFKADTLTNGSTHSNFDLTVWRFADPILTTPIMPMEENEAQAASAIQTHAGTCKSFGYGLDNEEKSGILRGAYTPITRAAPSILISDLSSHQYYDVPTGRTDHGDSGGALICKSTNGKEKLFGVVSRGGPVSYVDTMTVEEVGMYAKVAYNSSWIQHVLKSGPQVRPSDSNWWDQFVVQYEVDQMQNSFSEIRSCLSTARQRMNSDDAAEISRALQELQEKYKAAVKLSRSYGNDPGLLRIKVRTVFTDSRRLLVTCSQY